jgi:hypothetical protein
MNDHSVATLYKLRYEALKHPTRPFSVQGSKTPYEDLMAWLIRERYGPWTESQMLKYQETMLRIERNFDRIYRNKTP